MIRIDLKLWPLGMSARESSLGFVNVALVRTNSAGTRGDYEVELYSRGNKPRLVRSAKIENWPRKAKTAAALCAEAMKVLFPD